MKIMISGGADFIGGNFVRYVSLLKDEYVQLDTPWLDADYILGHNSTKV